MAARTMRTRRKHEGRSSRPVQRVASREPPLADPAPSAADVARYNADMTAQLASMAHAARLDLLVYFLNMANAESETHARKPGDREPT